MTYIYLMRHGETLFNQLKLIQGACDSPLTEQGIKQAKIVRNHFEHKSIQFNQVYSSTQERAVDTAKIVGLCEDQQVIRKKGLKEWNFGVFEGAPEYLNPPISENARTYQDFFSKYGGETDQEVGHRIDKTIRAIVKNHKENDNLLIVSHGGAMWTFYLLYEDDSQPVPKLSNCCVLKYKVKDDNFIYEGYMNLEEMMDKMHNI